MNQPTTVTQTFDTSLVDVTRSFSSTETNTSGSSAKENLQPDDPPPRLRSPYTEVPTEELYEQWASTYDTDGNILQFVDDLMMEELLPDFVSLVNARSRNAGRQNLEILDLGCGTGRNTLKLLRVRWDAKDVEIVGWDGSEAMLDLARSKCDSNTLNRTSGIKLHLAQKDISDLSNITDDYNAFFDGLISTLVLEHIKVDPFFNLIATVLKSGGYALVTNMHPDMGAVSRAGFKTAAGERFKATSYIHGVSETIDAARLAGLELVSEVGEKGVEEAMFGGGVVDGCSDERSLVAERAKKWIGTKVWYGMLFRKK